MLATHSNDPCAYASSYNHAEAHLCLLNHDCVRACVCSQRACTDTFECMHFIRDSLLLVMEAKLLELPKIRGLDTTLYSLFIWQFTIPRVFQQNRSMRNNTHLS